MEQMYLIEVFLDKVIVFMSDENENPSEKNLIAKIDFGPNQLIFKEDQLAVSNEKRDNAIEVTEKDRKQWSRTFRIGKSYLFPSYPDTVTGMLTKFPLQIAVWNDDVTETIDYVGIGTMNWHTSFFHYIKETSNACRSHETLSIKEVITLYQECCCVEAGEINFILRLSALGGAIVTDFQQLMNDPERFCFRTNKAPSMFECKRIEADDPKFCMTGSAYESAAREDADLEDQDTDTKIKICTELQSCGVTGTEANVCARDTDDSGTSAKKYPINKIRMGDITGPCGNSTCPLALKVRTYIRHLDAYKAKAGGIKEQKPEDLTKKICGSCICKDDRWHREECLEAKEKPEKVKCSGCSGMAKPGDTCVDRKNKHFGTAATPLGTPNINNINFVTRVPDYKDAIFRQDYVVENCYASTYICQRPISVGSKVSAAASSITSKPPAKNKLEVTTSKTLFNFSVTENNKPWVYNVSRQQPITVYNVTTTEDDCRCNPPKPSPPCKAFDCNCIAETSNITSRKHHRPYCPLYKHKSTCPVTMKHDEEGEKKEDDEDEREPLPYGLPPIQLGPCPVMGRPCTVPDGFARMYKNAVLPSQPPSYSDAGKVCCSKEYEKIKKAIKEYMKNQKDHDMRCINQFNVDTERRCCDKEQVLRSLMGRECCGAHKLAIQKKFKGDKP